MSEIHENDKRLITDLHALLDQVDKVRRGLTGRGFSPTRNGCVCEGNSLCAHHAEVYNRLDQASDSLALAIREAGRVE